MLRRVILHGRMKKLFGGPFSFDVQTAGEALRALNVNLPGFLDALKEGAYEVVRGTVKTGQRLELEQVNEFKLGDADFHLIPVIAGSKRSGLVKTILGVALIGAAVFFSGGIAGLAAPLGATGILGGGFATNLAIAGLALTFAGVSSLLTPKNQTKNSDASFELSGPGNTYGQGNPVPVVYGRCMVGAHMISAGLDVEPINVTYQPYVPGYYG